MSLVNAVQLHLRENHLIELTDYELGEFIGFINAKATLAGFNEGRTSEEAVLTILTNLLEDRGIEDLMEFTGANDDLLRAIRSSMK